MWNGGCFHRYTNILKRKNTQNRTKVYNEYLKGRYKKDRRRNKIPTNPHLEWNKVKKLNKERSSLSRHKLFQKRKLQRKEIFILWIEISSLSKTILFLSCHSIQKRDNRVVIHAFLCFLPMKDLNQLR